MLVKNYYGSYRNEIQQYIYGYIPLVFRKPRVSNYVDEHEIQKGQHLSPMLSPVSTTIAFIQIYLLKNAKIKTGKKLIS